MIKWLAVFLPPILVGGAVVYYCQDAYARGLDFTPGLHVFGYAAAMMYLLPLAIASIVIAWLVVLKVGCEQRGSLASVAFFSTVVSILLCLAAVSLQASAFDRGRSRAYREADKQKLAKVCRTFHASLAATPDSIKEPIWFNSSYPEEFEKLPFALRSFNPKDIYIGQRGVIVEMDGGGPAAHEGFFVPVVPLPESADAYARRLKLHVLNKDPPVFFFRLDDCRMLLD